jgi:hypothetical protein
MIDAAALSVVTGFFRGCNGFFRGCNGFFRGGPVRCAAARGSAVQHGRAAMQRNAAGATFTILHETMQVQHDHIRALEYKPK